jgi:hypothetical protein
MDRYIKIGADGKPTFDKEAFLVAQMGNNHQNGGHTRERSRSPLGGRVGNDVDELLRRSRRGAADGSSAE